MIPTTSLYTLPPLPPQDVRHPYPRQPNCHYQDSLKCDSEAVAADHTCYNPHHLQHLEHACYSQIPQQHSPAATVSGQHYNRSIDTPFARVQQACQLQQECYSPQVQQECYSPDIPTGLRGVRGAEAGGRTGDQLVRHAGYGAEGVGVPPGCPQQEDGELTPKALPHMVAQLCSREAQHMSFLNDQVRGGGLLGLVTGGGGHGRPQEVKRESDCPDWGRGAQV